MTLEHGMALNTGRISQHKNHALVIVQTLGSGIAEGRAWGRW